MTIKFQSEKHERDFRGLLSKMKSNDCYHKAVAYLLTLDEVCSNTSQTFSTLKRT